MKARKIFFKQNVYENYFLFIRKMFLFCVFYFLEFTITLKFESLNISLEFFFQLFV